MCLKGAKDSNDFLFAENLVAVVSAKITLSPESYLSNPIAWLYFTLSLALTGCRQTFLRKSYKICHGVIQIALFVHMVNTGSFLGC